MYASCAQLRACLEAPFGIGIGGIDIGFFDFLHTLAQTPLLLAASLLAVGVLVVNGGTDAPNAIAACVTSRAMPPKAAVGMAAVCNLLGVVAVTSVNATVAETVSTMVDFGSDRQLALIGLCAGMAAVVLWAAAAWVFGIPTSESHALIAGLSGAAIAANRDSGAINGAEWAKVLYGLPFSICMGLLAGFLATLALRRGLRAADRRKTARPMRLLQIFGGAAMAFAHGAQDGQKFIGVFLLAIALSTGGSVGELPIPLWLSASAALLMALGTALGGSRIIRTVGMRMVSPAPHEGFAADMAAAASLLGASMLGLPVSTTHMKTTAMMGAAATGRLRAVNWKVAADMLWAWVLTFPGCGAVGYLAARILLRLFS